MPLPPTRELPLSAPAPGSVSIVVARAVRQTDPQAEPCGAANCLSWFLGEFDDARTVSGAALPAAFNARIKMGSPFISRYTLAMIVERLPDGTQRVRATRGFHWQTHLACFERADTATLGLQPDDRGLIESNGQLCVRE
ncbi:hypothetical protein BH09PSE4_BH09PSE4_06340 [soil metagenome]